VLPPSLKLWRTSDAGCSIFAAGEQKRAFLCVSVCPGVISIQNTVKKPLQNAKSLASEKKCPDFYEFHLKNVIIFLYQL